MENKKSVLIIEDDETLSTLLSKHLERNGFQVIQSFDGESGLNHMLNDKIDLVIMDIVMPKKNGIVVLNEFHEKFPESKLPILVLSNSNDIHDIEAAVSHKVFAYLVKSNQRLENLLEIVKKAMGITKV